MNSNLEVLAKLLRYPARLTRIQKRNGTTTSCLLKSEKKEVKEGFHKKRSALTELSKTKSQIFKVDRRKAAQ